MNATQKCRCKSFSAKLKNAVLEAETHKALVKRTPRRKSVGDKHRRDIHSLTEKLTILGIELAVPRIRSLEGRSDRSISYIRKNGQTL